MATTADEIYSDQSMTGRDCHVGLPADPFTALKPHFGMLLGVADFQTIDAYHRGKQRLHNAWLHRQGVVWGFEVSLDAERNEIRVAPGLALDALGRELYLAGPVCLNLPAWLDKHGEEPEVEETLERDGDILRLDAHVVIQFRACLGRQVPALMEPCDGGGATTAYSRVLETVEVLLKPGPAPLPGGPERMLPYHRLRLLFALEAPIEEEGAVRESDQEVLDRRNEILGLPSGDQPGAYLEAFREFAALDGMGLRPALTPDGEPVSIFPATDPAPLILADLDDLELRDSELLNGGVDNTVRDSHVATATIQELLCGPLFALVEGAIPVPEAEDEDAGGPRVDPESLEVDGVELHLTHDGPRLLARSMAAGTSVFVSSYDVDDGWSLLPIDDITYDSGDKRINIFLEEDPEDALLRIVIKGSGPTPVLGTTGDLTRIPLAGASGGPPAGPHEGNDFVHMFTTEG